VGTRRGWRVVESDGERLREGRAPVSGGDARTRQAGTAAVLITVYMQSVKTRLWKLPF